MLLRNVGWLNGLHRDISQKTKVFSANSYILIMGVKETGQ
jgi:hypothetical protein